MNNYIEGVFLLNFILDFMILYGTKRLLKINVSIIRIITGSIVGGVSTFLLFIDYSDTFLILFKLLFASILVFITFGYKKLFYNTFYFFMISIIIGGFIFLFDLDQSNSFYYIFLILGSLLIISILIKELSNYKNKTSLEYIVDIYYLNKKYSLKGFIDTGNNLISPYHKEVIIITNLNINASKTIYVPYKALNTSGVIPCIRPDKVVINKKIFNKCLIALAKDKISINDISCILPNKFREELC